MLDGAALKWLTVSITEVPDHYAITDGVELIHILMGHLQWIQMWNVQLSCRAFKDDYGPGFCWEGDDLILTRNTQDSIPSS